MTLGPAIRAITARALEAEAKPTIDFVPKRLTVLAVVVSAIGHWKVPSLDGETFIEAFGDGRTIHKSSVVL
jgi:hypothetical protein